MLRALILPLRAARLAHGVVRSLSTAAGAGSYDTAAAAVAGSAAAPIDPAAAAPADPSAATSLARGDVPGASAAAAGADGLYVMLYTCRVCDTRSARRVSKHAYHHGTVLVRCPGCLGLHLIADHLGFVSDEPVDAEALLAARGDAPAARLPAPGAAAADPNVYELSADDRRVLASRTKAVRLRDGPRGPAGEEVDVATFAGVADGVRAAALGGRAPPTAADAELHDGA